MAEAAGLAFGALSIAGLFSTCVQCFDIIVAARGFSNEFEQLSALLSIQRLRFGLWGASVGLVPPPCGPQVPYNINIDNFEIQPVVLCALANIRQLLDNAAAVNAQYGLTSTEAPGTGLLIMKGMDIFKESYDHLKSRIRRNQSQKSTWKVTRWAIHDATKFENMITRLICFIDGLERATASLGLIAQQQALLYEEISSVSDAQSLRILQDTASSIRGASVNQDVWETASQRLEYIVAASIFEQKTIRTQAETNGTNESFYTAGYFSSARSNAESLYGLPKLPGAWPKSLTDATSSTRNSSGWRNYQRPAPPNIPIRMPIRPEKSCVNCQEEHYKCSVTDNAHSCTRCLEQRKTCDFVIQDGNPEQDDKGTAVEYERPLAPNDTPQNQRLLSELLRANRRPPPLCFMSGECNYGAQLSLIKRADEETWNNKSAQLVSLADSTTSVARRMFIELRNIRTGKIPFISAAPIGNNLDSILASIEGPPETPYEGGVFWLTVKVCPQTLNGLPLIRFHTRVFHPNIDCRGNFCADYQNKWGLTGSNGWYGKSSSLRWSLGGLLVAICGLLASPDVHDPLVPEIARQYLEDYDGYCHAARLYTHRYASAKRPAESDLKFLDLPAVTSMVAEGSVETVHEPSEDEKIMDRESTLEAFRKRYETNEACDDMCSLAPVLGPNPSFRLQKSTVSTFATSGSPSSSSNLSSSSNFSSGISLKSDDKKKFSWRGLLRGPLLPRR